MQLNDDDVKLILSKNIKSARIASNYTQEVLAEKANLSVNFIKDIEASRSGVSLATLINLRKVLKTSPNQLLKDFFKDSVNNSEDIVQQLNFLSTFERNAILTLINYFSTNDFNNIVSN